MTTYTYSQLETLWDNAGGSTAVAPVMAAIALAESGGNPDAHNSSGASGLWQILLPANAQYVPGGAANVYSPEANASAAVAIYKAQGLDAWQTYTNGAYKQFLNDTSASSPTSDTSASVSDPTGGLLSLPSQVTDFFNDANTLVTALSWLLQPSSWVRIGCFIIGVALLLFALHAFIAVSEGENILPSAPTVIPVPV